jgi:hypothetical protein
MTSVHLESESTGSSSPDEKPRQESHVDVANGDGPQRPSWREMALVAAGLAVLGAVVFGTHILHRGFYYDDWASYARTRWPKHGDGFVAAVRDTFHTFGYRPALAIYLPALYTVVGARMALHLAWILVLAIGLSTALYVLLRELAFPRLEAGAIAALVLIFPFSDTTRLWATAGTGSLTTGLFVIGLILSLRAFDEPDRRRSLRLHVAGASFYLFSMLFAEVAVVAIPAVFLLYAYRAGWRRALPRSLVDTAVIAAPAYYIASNSTIPEAASGFSTRISRVRVLADQSLTIATRSLDPWLSQGRNELLWLALGISAAATLYFFVGPRPTVRRELRRWLLAIPVTLVGLAAAYAIYIPADPYYVPLQPGVGNRVNVLAALALVTVATAVVALAATLVTAPLPETGRRLVAACLAGIALFAIGDRYARTTRADAAQYDRAFTREQSILDVLRTRLPRPPHSSMIFVVGHPIFEAPGVPVFAASWDFHGAVEYIYSDRTIRGNPILPGMKLSCGPTRVYPAGGAYRPVNGARYGRAYVFEVQSQRVLPLDNQKACRAAATTAVPGPFVAEPAPVP